MSPKPTRPNLLNSAAKTVRRLHFIIVIVAGILLIAGEILFLYRYFYQGLTESHLLVQLRQEEALEELQMPIYNKVREFSEIKQKERPIDWDALSNPFAKLPAETAPPRQSGQ